MSQADIGEKKFKRGEIICKAGTFDLTMYNIMYGQVGIYMNYDTPEERKVLEMHEGDFLNVISFLESRPRNTTAVALCQTVVHEITFDNFGSYFERQPAKIMSLLQHMSARMRALQGAYLTVCEKLDAYADKERLQQEEAEWQEKHDTTYRWLSSLFGSNLGDKT